MRTKNASLLLIVVIAALTISCSSPNSPVNNNLTLSAEVSCTEAWLKLSANNIALPKNVTITRDGNNIFSFSLTTRDTTLYDSILAPNKSYTYQALLSPLSGQSDKVVATTLDTTSHNFSWQTYTFGEGSSSVLYDVAIINENNIWAVGEIYMKDSTSKIDPNAYNAVHWNGNSWELKRIYYYGSCSAVKYPPLRSIYAFSSQNIIVTNGGSIGFFDENKIVLDCGVNHLLSGAINKIWGTSNQDFYIVGNNGNIAHYTNGSWQKIESGYSTNQGNSSINFTDIFGSKDNNQLYISGSSIDHSRSVLTKYDNNNVTTLWQRQGGVTPPYGDIVTSCWTNGKMLYTSSNYGVFYQYYKSKDVKQSLSLYRYPYRIRGTDINNVVVVGDRGMIWHYNGKSWMLQNQTTEVEPLYSVAISDNLIVALGTAPNAPLSKAIIYIGRR